MKREFLKELGLDDEVIGKVMAEHGKTVNTLKADADKVDTLEAQITDYQTRLKDRDTQLEDLKEKAKGNEELVSEINKLKEENDKAQKDYQAKLELQTFEFSLEKALSNAKAKNPKAVKALLNTETIKLDGNKLLGLEEQLKALQESDGYLFGVEEAPQLRGRQPQPPGQHQQTGVTKEQFEKMTYAEKVELYNSNVELYQQLSK